MTQKTYVAWHVCGIYFGDLFWPALDLDIFKYDLRSSYSRSTLLKHIPWNLGEFGLFVVHLTDPRAENVKTYHFEIWPDLNLTGDLNVKMLSMDYVRFDESIRALRLSSHYNALFQDDMGDPPPLPSLRPESMPD